MIYIVARSKQHGEDFIKSHSGFSSLVKIKLRHRSYFDILTDLLCCNEEKYACVVHDDVVLCDHFPEKLNALIEELNRDWPNWGLVGNAAILSMHVGYSANNIVRYISDPHGGPNLTGHILPAQSIDGNVMLLNLNSMRAKAVSLPAWDGYQLYDLTLSIETLAAGLGVFVAPHLACWHKSGGSQAEFDTAKQAESFNTYLLNRLCNRKINSLNGPIPIHFGKTHINDRGIVDIEMDSLRSAAHDRRPKTVAIVTRTQFKRPTLLDRTLKTVRAFIAAAGTDHIHYTHYVIFDNNADSLPQNLADNAAIFMNANLSKDDDTRYLLVNFAVQNIDADYFWFLDDDDWLFPNEAERLSLILNTMPESSVIFVDSQHYLEQPVLGHSLESPPLYRSTEGRYFPAHQFMNSLSGHNHSPFCGVIYPRGALLSINPDIYSAVTYYEDFMTTLTVLLSNYIFPVSVNKLIAGISLRKAEGTAGETGNTVSEKNRSKWDKSMSELVSQLVNAKGKPSQLISVSAMNSSSGATAAQNTEIALLRAQINIIARSRSWKLTKPLRVAARLIRRELTLAEIIQRLRTTSSR